MECSWAAVGLAAAGGGWAPAAPSAFCSMRCSTMFSLRMPFEELWWLWWEDLKISSARTSSRVPLSDPTPTASVRKKGQQAPGLQLERKEIS
eukprot:6591127-Pyramimonas_sp.AAC.1